MHQSQLNTRRKVENVIKISSTLDKTTLNAFVRQMANATKKFYHQSLKDDI